jgi:hypothetical protein
MGKRNDESMDHILSLLFFFLWGGGGGGGGLSWVMRKRNWENCNCGQ